LVPKYNDNHILQGVVEEKSMIKNEVGFIHTLKDMDSKNTLVASGDSQHDAIRIKGINKEDYDKTVPNRTNLAQLVPNNTPISKMERGRG